MGGNFCETTMLHTSMWSSYPSFNHTIVNYRLSSSIVWSSNLTYIIIYTIYIIILKHICCNPIKPAANATLPSTLELRLPHHAAAATRRPSPRRGVPVDWGEKGASGAHGSAAIGDIETMSFFGHQFLFDRTCSPTFSPYKWPVENVHEHIAE